MINKNSKASYGSIESMSEGIYKIVMDDGSVIHHKIFIEGAKVNDVVSLKGGKFTKDDDETKRRVKTIKDLQDKVFI